MIIRTNKFLSSIRVFQAKLGHRTFKRSFHLTSKLEGAPHGEHPVKNFEDFKVPNQVGTFEHYRMPQDLLDVEYNYPVCRDTLGIRWPGYWFKRKFCYVKEMEPELVVPDLEGFELKPYVSYRTEEVDNKPFTPKDLFDSVYADRIAEEFKEKGSVELNLDQENIYEARLKALQTGSDLFEEHTVDGVRAPMKYVV